MNLPHSPSPASIIRPLPVLSASPQLRGVLPPEEPEVKLAEAPQARPGGTSPEKSPRVLCPLPGGLPSPDSTALVSPRALGVI